MLRASEAIGDFFFLVCDFFFSFAFRVVNEKRSVGFFFGEKKRNVSRNEKSMAQGRKKKLKSARLGKVVRANLFVTLRDAHATRFAI